MNYQDRRCKAENLMNQLRPLFEEKANIAWKNPNIIQPSDPFLSLLGEDMRTRLVFAQAGDAQNLCLRPEFTIPICLDLIKEDASKLNSEHVFAYHGEAFRLRKDRNYGAFQQAGIEWIGGVKTDDPALESHASEAGYSLNDENEKDLEALNFAFNVQEVLGFDQLRFVLGDVRLYDALIDDLDLPPATSLRLKKLEHSKLTSNDLMDQLKARGAQQNRLHEENETLSLQSRALVKDIFSALGLHEIAGRSAEEIAERFTLTSGQESKNSSGDIDLSLFREYIALTGSLESISDRLSKMHENAGVQFKAEIERFLIKLMTMERKGFSLANIDFLAHPPRKLDYYSGIVFALKKADAHAPILLSGGRYSGLLERLGMQHKLSNSHLKIDGIGCAIWLDDIVRYQNKA